MANQSKFRSVSNVVNLGQSSILAMCQDDDWNLKSTGSEPISAVLSIMEKKEHETFSPAAAAARNKSQTITWKFQ